MSRYIDADALLANVDKYPYAQGLMDLIADIQTAPSIDIVRCKECKHWHRYIDSINQGRCDVEDALGYMATEVISPTEDFFCKQGERREDAD